MNRLITANQRGGGRQVRPKRSGLARQRQASEPRASLKRGTGEVRSRGSAYKLMLGWLICCTVTDVAGGQVVWASNVRQEGSDRTAEEAASGKEMRLNLVAPPDQSSLLPPLGLDSNRQDDHLSDDKLSPAPDMGLPIKYWGNSFSGKFHRPSCPFAQAMSLRHVIFFNFRRQAVESGQSPCRYCLPPFWTSVKVKILPRAEKSDEEAKPSI